MKKEVTLSNGVACVIKKYRRAKRMRITLHGDGSVLLTLPFFVPYRAGIAFLESHKEWIKKKQEAFLAAPENVLRKGSRGEYEKYKEEARELIERRLEHFRGVYQVKWNRVSIRNQKTRWGSCSRRGDLSFNYKLLLLPPHLRDYVVVHELCHLKEFNHSPKFWALVARTFPDYPLLRKELRLL